MKDFAFPFFNRFPFIGKCEKMLKKALIIKNEKCHNVKYEMINNFFSTFKYLD